MDGFGQQVNQVVSQTAGTQINESCQPGDASRIGVAAQVARHLDRYTLAAALQITRCSTVEQIGWKLNLSDQLQLRQFVLHAGQTGATRAAAQFQEYRWRAAGCIFLVLDGIVIDVFLGT